MPSQTASAMLNRRFLILLLTAAAILCFTYLGLFRSNHSSASYSKTPIHHVTVADSTLKGDAIMGKIGNETLKYDNTMEYMIGSGSVLMNIAS